MRITGNSPISSVQGKGGKKKVSGGDGGFLIGSDEESVASASTSSASAISGLDALLALQGVGVEKDDRDVAKERGHAMLDILDALKADLLGGVLTGGHLDDLSARLSQRQPSGDSRLDSVIDEIELRVRVELAKRGRFEG